MPNVDSEFSMAYFAFWNLADFESVPHFISAKLLLEPPTATIIEEVFFLYSTPSESVADGEVCKDKEKLLKR